MTSALLLLVALQQIEVVDHIRSTTPVAPVSSLEVVDHTISSKKTNRGYPALHASRWWYHNGHWPQPPHLNEGEHTGLFDEKWLRTLSPQHLLNLHSDAHENRVNWDYAFRPGQFFEFKSPSVAKRLVWRCSNGCCYQTWE